MNAPIAPTSLASRPPLTPVLLILLALLSPFTPLSRDPAARAMSLMMACTSIVPMLGAVIGGQILSFLGWRAIFWTLGAIGLFALLAAYLRLPETLRPEYRQPLVLSSVLKRFGELFRHRAFMGYAFTSTFMFSALLSFLSGSPFVFIERYGVAPRAYGRTFGGIVGLL